jgi:TetR/AcrR family tetracycline transcriptional repressor
MARPSTPLINREETIRVALQIIDDEGIEALSLPRLARELNVRAPSLYHHFADKDEILAAVCQAIVTKTVLPRRPDDGDWAGWFTQLAMNFRTAVLRHRRAAPLLLRYMPRDFLTDLYEQAASYLTECNIPVDTQLLILNGLEKLSIGAAITEAVQPPSKGPVRFRRVDPERHPVLAAASEANNLSAKDMFENAVRSYLLGLDHFYLASPTA